MKFSRLILLGAMTILFLAMVGFAVSLGNGVPKKVDAGASAMPRVYEATIDGKLITLREYAVCYAELAGEANASPALSVKCYLPGSNWTIDEADYRFIASSLKRIK